MKKTLVPVLLMAVILLTSMPAMAWRHYGGPGPGWRGGYGGPPPRYHHHGGRGIGGVVGGLLVGGLIAGTVVAATRPPVQVVQQPVYVSAQPMMVQQAAPRMCSEERRVTGEYQYDANGNTVWVEFAHPVVRSYQVPCP
ncbi:MAG: hypothetical protein LBU39_08970 [Desulfobulbaceae bacterium]|jgi:hypothetical protein|nr:hypothetical protein [Desulfobulbaceae bacterium]